jgi:hypothetical protein
LQLEPDKTLEMTRAGSGLLCTSSQLFIKTTSYFQEFPAAMSLNARCFGRKHKRPQSSFW